ncbi:hypothetical protein CEXT_57911 [Caerostris extrusa]|uniref:Uncharacterized protein n=1 Tax=Caerostris extrusa TaxID=172846 RepID=A0AAV4SMP4_CAEEX|nr:hypothetical protein CEXT_57911 [Caerostris extrusa]
MHLLSSFTTLVLPQHESPQHQSCQSKPRIRLPLSTGQMINCTEAAEAPPRFSAQTNKRARVLFARRDAGQGSWLLPSQRRCAWCTGSAHSPGCPAECTFRIG